MAALRADLAVVGAGAAGVAACHAARSVAAGISLALLERKGRALTKFRITGKGRCNLTSCVSPRVFLERLGRNGRFLRPALARFDAEATRALFASFGVPTRVERGDRVFPESDSAVDAAERFLAPLLAESPPMLHPGALVRRIDPLPDGAGFALETSDGVVRARRVVVATGGITYPATGSDGSMFAELARLGHAVIPARHALCGMVARPGAPLPPAGNALRNVEASLWRDGRRVAASFGELLFTHDGISGPAVLHLSRDGRDAFDRDGRACGAVEVRIDLKPGIPDEELASRLDRDLAENPRKALPHALGGLLPAPLLASALAAAGAPPELRAADAARPLRRRIAAALRALPVPVAALDGPEHAVITLGGVDLKQVDPRTMESKIVPGLHLAGELLDLDGPTGGYNLQIAFTTGWVAGAAAAEALQGQGCGEVPSG